MKNLSVTSFFTCLVGVSVLSLGAQILKDLGISSIRLLTSAEHRYIGLSGFGIEIVSVEPIE